MYISFSRKLMKLGKMRIGVGFRAKGWTAAIMVFMYAMLYMCWYAMLGALWLAYGLGYVFYYLPAKWLVKFCKQKKREKQIAESSKKYERAPSQVDN